MCVRVCVCVSACMSACVRVTCGWVDAGGDVEVAQCVGVQHVGAMRVVFVLLLGQRTAV